MIRFFVLTGLVGGALVAWLTTAGVGPISQLPQSESLLTKFRAMGYLPKNLNLSEDEDQEHGIFDLPAMDEVMLEAALEAQGDMMAGMDMSGSSDGTMDMSGSDSGTIDMSSSDSGTMDMSGSDGGTMDMAEGSTMDMDMDGDGKPDMRASDMTQGSTQSMSEGENMDMGMDMEGDTTSDMKMDGDGDAMAMDMGEGGLVFTETGGFDREFDLSMSEWKFSEMSIDVKMGERIRFNVKNDGQIPHEFMFMSPPLMQAVTYRATRADWSLFEHEALFEKSLVLPGGDFSFIVTVTEPGTWMFMCMLPYHMQMGMMGQMATEGMAMDMDM